MKEIKTNNKTIINNNLITLLKTDLLQLIIHQQIKSLMLNLSQNNKTKDNQKKKKVLSINNLKKKAILINRI